HLIAPPVEIPFVFSPDPDGRVVVFVALVTVVTAVLFGLAPALTASRADVAGVIKDETTIGGRGRSRLRGALVVAQLALSLVLLIGAALFSRSLEEAEHMSPGFDPRNGLTAQLDLRFIRSDAGSARRFFRTVLE